jgi:hypothetical protein
MSESMRRSALVEPSGRPISNLSWKPPQAGGYFGWLSADGFNTVKLDSIQAICPSTNRNDSHMISLQHGVAMVINNLDAARLMKKLGWKEPEATKGHGG